MEYGNNRLYGQSVMEYIERMSMAGREDEPNSKERVAYYKAVFYLNLELEDEIKARKEELAQLKRVKAVFENALILSGITDEILANDLFGDDAEMALVRIQLEKESAEKLEKIAKKQKTSVSELVSGMLEKQLEKEEKSKKP